MNNLIDFKYLISGILIFILGILCVILENSLLSFIFGMLSVFLLVKSVYVGLFQLMIKKCELYDKMFGDKND